MLRNDLSCRRRLGDDRDRGRSASSIGVPRHFVLPSPAASSPPWRPTGRRSRSTGRRASSIGGPRRPTSCCRGGDGSLGAIAAKKKRPTASCCRSVWEGMSNPSTRRVAQKIRGQSFPSLTEASPAGFLLARQVQPKRKGPQLPAAVRLGGHVQSEYPSGRPENPRQSFPS